jgi:hypothetical protein
MKSLILDNNIKMHNGEISCKDVKRNYLVEDEIRCRRFVNEQRKLGFHPREVRDQQRTIHQLP